MAIAATQEPKKYTLTNQADVVEKNIQLAEDARERMADINRKVGLYKQKREESTTVAAKTYYDKKIQKLIPQLLTALAMIQATTGE